MRITVPQRGEKLRLSELAEVNARQVLEDRIIALTYADNRAEDALFSLQDELSLKVVPRLMVCFDVSHMQGKETVASAVVFQNGEPSRADYRHMRIKGDWGNDDFQSMQEAVHRYFRRRLDERTPLPDLVVIDGGRTNRTLRSQLGDIPGIGPHRQTVLLRRFGSLKGVKSATKEEIARVPGFSKALASRILTYLGN